MPLEQRFEVQFNQAAPWDRKVALVHYDGHREIARLTTSVDGLKTLGAAVGEAIVKLTATKPAARP